MPESAVSAEITPTSKLSPDEIVTLVVKHRVKQGLEAQYEAWLRRTVAIAGTYPGHLGVDVIRGKADGLHMFTCVLRFCSTEVMQSWLDSSQRRELVAEAAPMLADGDFTEVNRHNEFWFVPSSDTPPPPRWKQAVVTFFVICPADAADSAAVGAGISRHPVAGQLCDRHCVGDHHYRPAGGLPADAPSDPAGRTVAERQTRTCARGGP
jgi:antibiotic biosynthesis monooxygenase (ABM) superfamily enzyme